MAVITLENVSLSYPVFSNYSQSLKQVFLSRLGGVVSIHNNIVVVDALREVSFQLSDGDRLGIIGHNGAGKTTLLRTLAQVYEPQSGVVKIEGSLSSFVDITLGMNPDATGWENIVLRGVFLGLTFKEARERSQSIADFSELGEYLDMPVRTYSAGMYMRLAFAVTSSISPDILIMDEMIGAGDARFFDKAIARMTSMIGKTKIMVVATHSNEIIRKFCNKVLWMDKGRIREIGAVEEIIPKFELDSSSLNI